MWRIDWGRLQAILVCLVLMLILLAVLGWLLSQISYVLEVFIVAGVLALVLAPLVDWVQDHRLPRWLAVVLIDLLIAAVTLVGAFLLVSHLVSEAIQLSNDLPGYVAEVNDELYQLEERLRGTPFAGVLDVVHDQLLTAVSDWSGSLVRGLIGGLAGLAGRVVDGFIVFIVSIYMLLAGQRAYAAMCDAIPGGGRSHFVFTTGTLTRVLGSYIRTQLALALMLGVVVAVGMKLLSVPYELLLAVLATVLGLIPMFGSVLSAVPALLIALTQPFPTVLWVLIFFLVVQNVLDQIVAPQLHASSIGLHPLAVIFALLAGVQIGGVLGAIFALPVAGFLWIVCVAVQPGLRTLLEPLGPAPTGPTRADVSPPQSAYAADQRQD